MKKLKNSIIYLLCMVMMLGIVEPVQAQAATTDTTSEEEIEDIDFKISDFVTNVKCKVTKNKKSKKEEDAYIYTYTWKINKSSKLYKALQPYDIYNHTTINFDVLQYTKYEDIGVPIKKEKVVIKNYAPGNGGTFNTRYDFEIDESYLV